MSQELADTQVSEQTTAVVEPSGNVETPVTEKRSEPSDKKPSVREAILAAKAEVEENEKKRGNPYKAADGKFTKKPLEAKAPVEAAPAQESEVKTEVAPTPQAKEPPKSWAKEKHAIWAGLTPEAQDLILSREAQVNEGFAKYQGIEPKFKELDAVLSPLDPMISSYGTTRGQFVKQLTDWHMALSNNPLEAFPALMRAYGFNPQGSSAQPSNDLIDPLRPVLSQYEQGISEAKREAQEARRALDEMQRSQVSRDIAKWAEGKPHYEKVRQQMGLLIKSAAEVGQELSLDDAYDQAVWANPETRDALKKAEFEAQVKAQKEAAEKARIAAISAGTRSPAAPVPNGASKPDGSVRGSIKAAIAEARANGRA